MFSVWSFLNRGRGVKSRIRPRVVYYPRGGSSSPSRIYFELTGGRAREGDVLSSNERFPHETLSEALERSLRNARQLKAKDAATVAAARSLARRIDCWDELAKLALEQAGNKRAAVPQNDNTLLPTYLKYCDALGLTPESPPPAKSATSAPTARAEAEPQKTGNKILAFRAGT